MSIATTCTPIATITASSSFNGAERDIGSLSAASTSTNSTETAALSLLDKLRVPKTSELGRSKAKSAREPGP